jgi:hypothetical protein
MASVLGNSGNGVSLVITDLRCNGHRTAEGCFERSVRLPAALRAAKLAGGTVDGRTKLVTSVPQKYMDMAEKNVLIKAHSAAYLKRMKGRCASTKDEDEVIKLTDDSDGDGGEDTSEYVVVIPYRQNLLF